MKPKFTTLFAAVLLVAVIVASVFVYQPANAATTCSCLVYFQYNKTLPPTGQTNFAAYKYGDWLATYKGSYSPKGYNVTYTTPSTTAFGQLLLVGKAIVFNPGALGANATYGHIGIVTSASYNSTTKKWTIQFKDANSGYSLAPGQKSLFTESGCTNVGVRQIVTSSLSGLRFFSWSKK